MKKLTSSLMAMAFVGAMALPAMADVSVTANITKTKEKAVIEDVTIVKNIVLGIKQIAAPTNSAEAQAVKNDVNTGNTLTETPVAGTPAEYYWDQASETNVIMTPAIPGTATTKSATINGGVGNDSAGIVGINQAPGSMDNQGNATAVAITAAGNAFVHAEASAQQVNGAYVGLDGTTVDATGGNAVTATRTSRTDTIDAALQNVVGILSVNQSAGSMNNQNNGLALSVGATAIACLSEADLGMVNAMNTSDEKGVTLADTLTGGALSGSKGIVSINQSSGCMNNQSNIVSVCALSTSPL